MAPIIPSPTPITGIVNPDGTTRPGKRLPLAVLQQNDFAFALYAQALLAWQKDGCETKDIDAKLGTSYFQVTGVHGVPYVPWQEDPEKLVVGTSGYCTHRSVLFVPWHRPYLLLYEQIIYQYALDIVNEATGYPKQAYEAVLDFIRLPYWDFNKDSSLPQVVRQDTLDVIVPGKSEGQKETITLKHNPFYSYKFTSDYAWNIIVEKMEWNQWKDENLVHESKRCPDENGVSRPEIANAQLQTVGDDYKERAYSLLTSVHDFAEFSTQAWNGGPDANYDSVEVWHNFVHNYSGTQDDDFKNFKQFPEHHKMVAKSPEGNLTEVQASSFDPLFWLLHCHIDRLAAIWQAMHYQDIKIERTKSYTDRANAASGTWEDGESQLQPWHTSPSHDTADYWIANDTKDLKSTFDNGYYYPETPFDLRTDNIKMKKFATAQVNELYAKPKVVKKIHQVAPAMAARHGGPDAESAESDTAVASSALKPIQSVEWRAFVRVKSFAVPGTWGIHLFLGEPPAQSSEWFMSEQRVGTVNVLSNSNANACANCKTQSDAGLLVTGIVLLSNELEKRGVDVSDRDAVVQYLKENLTWRIAKDALNVEIEPDMALVVGVAARDVAYPLEATDLPVWGTPQVFPATTEGKAGGLGYGATEL
ncbi:common central domain of tyrosinase-domain-containing protein [Massariosphaeria phaeospora]|uniref:tyrosinase n=1 Tax=Massariosphaeria phaeospora TaxID=100035 RepID=A0A7C8MEQ8_9PLEO|nr:common central domain of tyrosinase-domain-containing protein [Massariosphaeria phaeospora]